MQRHPEQFSQFVKNLINDESPDGLWDFPSKFIIEFLKQHPEYKDEIQALMYEKYFHNPSTTIEVSAYLGPGGRFEWLKEAFIETQLPKQHEKYPFQPFDVSYFGLNQYGIGEPLSVDFTHEELMAGFEGQPGKIYSYIQEYDSHDPKLVERLTEVYLGQTDQEKRLAMLRMEPVRGTNQPFIPKEALYPEDLAYLDSMSWGDVIGPHETEIDFKLKLFYCAETINLAEVLEFSWKGDAYMLPTEAAEVDPEIVWRLIDELKEVEEFREREEQKKDATSQ